MSAADDELTPMLTPDERAEYERLLAEARREKDVEMERQLRYELPVYALLREQIRDAARENEALRRQLADTQQRLEAALQSNEKTF